ncbi:tachykinin family [Pyrenophora seminiperda CCB06]|uniref:Tachykinin family n=1 Tax=Pyrenophora seminiperda CCB06 TaxID=1302712 RepID=A0A3M7MGX4_9PLEO|nr:tachykinin family [Pyrenophora seminiperda CCB06]
MASSNEPTKPAKRRVGRRRLPPLAQGPALQFVVANHPDDFRAGKVMRNVRSHVMYKHRENSGSSPTESGNSREGISAQSIMTRSPSPTMVGSGGILQTTTITPLRQDNTSWEHDPYDMQTPSPSTNSVRRLAAQILTGASSVPTRSSSPIFEGASEYPFTVRDTVSPEPLEDLKHNWIGTTAFFCHNQTWMRYVCNSYLSFLSHVHASLVYQDLDEGLLYDSELTVYGKTMILRLISDRLDTDDATIISILHLLISELGALNEDVFNLHQEGLVTCLRNQRDGLSSNVATFMTLVMLTFAISRGRTESAELTPRPSAEAWSDTASPISPLSTPLENTSRLYRGCSAGTSEIVNGMQICTHVFLARCNNHLGGGGSGTPTTSPNNAARLANYALQLQTIYSRIVSLPLTRADPEARQDWVYESCRLAALIYCRSLVKGTPFAHSANTTTTTTTTTSRPSSPESVTPGTTTTTLLLALHAALLQTEPRNCWGPALSGVFLWVTLIGAAASWSTEVAWPESTLQSLPWMRKCFALYAVRAAVSVPFEHADATIRALRTMLMVRGCLGGGGGGGAVVGAENQ